jgi:bacillithiol biosynthesis cysteine-adding enzyme BshC
MQPKRSIEKDYLAAEPHLRSFYRWPLQIEILPELIEARSRFPLDRATLAQVFKEQYTSWGITEAGINNLIDSILSARTFFITTGQQPVFLGGPIYVVYKALTAVALAQNLQAQYPEFRFVPLFWIASEDHDYREINHCYFDFSQKTTYKGTFSGAVGRHLIDNQIIPLLSALPNIQRFYLPGQKWGAAFAQLLHAWLGKLGLLLLDPDNLALKRLFSEIMLKEAMEGASYPLVEATSRELNALGYKAQAKAQPINLFYLTHRLRERLVWDSSRIEYYVRNSDYRFSRHELEEAINERPHFFSPNVILRPIYQETILPNLVYVGGWGEIAYWLQLKKVFESYQTFYPLLYPRFSALLVTADQKERLAQAHVALEELLQPDKALFTQIAEKLWNSSIIDKTHQQLEILLESLALELESFAPGQAYSARALLQKNKLYLARLRHRANKQAINRYPSTWGALWRLKQSIQPEGVIQERTLNLLAFARQEQDIAYVIQRIFSFIQPWFFERKIIYL